MRSTSKVKKQEDQKTTNSDSPVLDMKNAEIKALVKKAKSTGYITHEELSKALPSDALTADQIEDWYTALSELGINVIEQNEETNQEETMLCGKGRKKRKAAQQCEQDLCSNEQPMLKSKLKFQRPTLFQHRR